MAGTRRVPSAADPALLELTSFAFYATTGVFRVYKYGKLIEEEPANDFRNGVLRYVVLNDREASVVGNQGMDRVEVTQRSPRGLVIVESTIAGRMVLTVYPEPHSAGGFRARYSRAIETFDGELLRTEYEGYVR